MRWIVHSLLLLWAFLLLGAACPTFAATIYANNSTGNDTTGNGSSANPYATFTKAYTAASSGDTIDLTGTFTWTDAGETGDAATTGYTINKNLTIEGQGADQTIVQTDTSSTTAASRVFTISASSTVILKNLEIRNGKVASVYGGGIQNNGALSVYGVRIDDNISGEGGSGIDNLNLLTVASSTIDHNLANGSTGMGAGILSDYYIVSGGYTTITDSTIAYNTITATTGYYSGAGVHLRKGSATITNSTISNNESCESSVGEDDPGSVLTIKNTIIAANRYHSGSFCTSNLPVDFAYRQSGYGNVVDNGDNIVGYSNLYTWSGTGDWTDTNRDGIFVEQTSAATGTLNLSSTLATNNNTSNGTQTFALSAGSIAIDNGSTGSNGSTSTVPLLDQRGAGRSGAPDVGAYEYNGSLTDTTPPSVSITAPTASEATSSNITLAASASDDFGVAGVTFYVDGAKQGTEITSAPYRLTFDTTATSTGAHTVFAVARDTSNNFATSSTITFSINNTVPTLSSIVASSTDSAATISWNSDLSGSTKIYFGLDPSYSSSTATMDMAGTTMHLFTLQGLPSCVKYHYATVSTDLFGITATSSDGTFSTGGCTGNAAISTSGYSNLTTTSGGTLAQGSLTLSIPASFTATSSAAVFEANKLDSTAFFASAGIPSGETKAGTNVFHLVALTDATTTLATFSQPISVTLSYSPSDISGLDTGTLTLYRYDAPTWTALSGCSVDTTASTVTCQTQNFSDIALFGQAPATPTASNSGAVNGGIVIGCMDKSALNYSPAAVISDNRCQYAQTVASFKPSPTASSSRMTFVRELKLGMSGEDVRALQQFLNTHGTPVALTGPGSSGKETPYFGKLTQRAVALFQSLYAKEILTPLNLKKGTGYFGFATMHEANALLGSSTASTL